MEPFVLGPDEGSSYAFGGGTVVVKAMPHQTGIGGFSVETFPPGFAAPLHRHTVDAGVFFVLEGAVRIMSGGVDTVAVAGSMVFLPAGVPHAFKVEGDAPARWFNVQSPNGDFLRASIAAAEGGPPPGGIERIGPPPF